MINFKNPIVALRRLLRLHLHDVELLRAVQAEQRCSPLEDLHHQQPGLRIRILDRTLVERLQQSIEAVHIKRDVAPPCIVIDLRQRAVERCIHLADGASFTLLTRFKAGRARLRCLQL